MYRLSPLCGSINSRFLVAMGRCPPGCAGTTTFPVPGSERGARPARSWRCRLFTDNQFWVEIRPLLVATIQRLPQRTTDSMRPIPGTVSPCAAGQTPPGPSSTAVPPTTSRIVQPSIVIGLVSGAGAGLGRIFARSWLDPAAMEFVVVTSLLAAALACCAGRDGSRARLAPAAGLASFAVVGALGATSRSVLAPAQALSLRRARAQAESAACCTGAAAGAKKKEGLAPPNHPTPT